MRWLRILSSTSYPLYLRNRLRWKKLLAVMLSSLLFLSPLFMSAAPQHDKDWSDLEENKYNFQGSEREKKFRVISPYLWEDWEGHTSHDVFYLYKYTNYPKFTSHRLLIVPAPIFYSLSSKIDNRWETWFAPLYYFKRDGDDFRFISLPGFISRERDGADYSLLYLAYYSYHDAPALSYRDVVVLPFFFSHDGHDFEDSTGITVHKRSLLILPLYLKRSEIRFNSQRDLKSSASTSYIPIIPFLFYNERDVFRNSSLTSWMTLYGRATEKDSLTARWLIPFYFYWQEKFHVSPTKKENLAPDTKRDSMPRDVAENGENVSSIRLRQNYLMVPLFFHSFDEMGNSTLVTVPFFYNRSPEKSHYSIAYLIHWEFEKEHLVSFIAPPLFYQQDSFMDLFPFYMHHTTASHYADSSLSSSFTAIPMVPFLYFHTSDGRTGSSTTSLLTLYGETKEKGAISALWLFPFYLYWQETLPSPTTAREGFATGKQINPVPTSETANVENTTIGHEENATTPTVEFRRSHLLVPLFFYSGDTRGHSSLVTPLFYTIKSPGESYHSIAYLAYWNRKNQILENFFALPLVYYKRDSYFHFIPFYFSAWNSKNDEKTTFGPGYYRHRKRNASETLLGNLWFSRNGASGSSTVYLFPVFFRSHNAAGESHYNLAGFLDWKTREDLFLSRLWLIPLFSYKRDGYFYTWLYLRPQSYDAPEGYVLGPLFYHSWTPATRHIFAGPYYESRDLMRNESYTHLLPLYYQWNGPDEKGYMLLPLRMQFEDRSKFFDFTLLYWTNRTSGSFYTDVAENGQVRWYLDTDWALLGYLVHHSTRRSIPAPTGTASLPHIPGRSALERLLSRKSTSQDAEGNPEPIPGTVAASGDTKIEAEKSVEPPRLQKREGVSRYGSLNYSETSALFGLISYAKADSRRHFRMLPLAWFTWDERTSDRILLAPPFLPIFFSYQSQDLEYIVLFPLYGKQRKGESSMVSYGTILFIREYDAQSQRHEYSFLWPIANFYQSPDSGGSRIFPVYYYSHNLSRERETIHLTILPLLFFHQSERFVYSQNPEQTLGERKSSLTLSPWYYRVLNSSDKESRTLFILPILPLFYRETNTTGSRYDNTTLLIPLFFRHSATEGNTTFVLPGLYFRNDAQGWTQNYLYLLHLNYNSTEKEMRTGLIGDSILFKHSPDGYGFHLLYGGLLSFERNSQIPAHHVSALFYLFHQEGDGTTNAGHLFPFYYYKTYGNGDSVALVPFVPFLFYRDVTGTDHHYNFLTIFDFQRNESAQSYRYSVLPLFQRIHAGDYDHLFLMGYYNRTDRTGERTNYLYLYDHLYDATDSRTTDGYLLHTVRYSTAPGETRFSLFYGILASYEYIDTEKNRSTLIAVPFLPFLYYQNTTADEEHRNILTIFDVLKNRSTGAYRYTLFPLFQRWHDQDYDHLFLAGYYNRTDKTGQRTDFLYLYDHLYNATDSRTSNGYLLYSIYSSTDPGEFQFSLLYGILAYYDTKKRSDDYALALGGFLFYSGMEKNDYSTHLVPLYYYSHNYNPGKEDMTILFPIIPIIFFGEYRERSSNVCIIACTAYYNGREEEHTRRLVLLGSLWYQDYDRVNSTATALFGTLWYRNRDATHETDTVLGGLLWYRNEDFEQKSEYMGLLFGGFLFAHEENPRKGFKKYGSIYSYLWDYEEETESGYHRLSILGIMKIHTPTEDYWRILGVRI